MSRAPQNNPNQQPPHHGFRLPRSERFHDAAVTTGEYIRSFVRLVYWILGGVLAICLAGAIGYVAVKALGWFVRLVSTALGV